MDTPAPPADRRALLQQALAALDEMQAKLDAAERARREPIAIVGVGCRFPGGGDGPEAFWRVLADGVDAVREVPPERWDRDAFFDPDPDAPGKMYSARGAFLAEPVDRFDAGFFGISPREAASMDPQQRLLLEVAWEALEHAGIAPGRLAGSKTGVFVGICTNDYAQLQSRSGGYETIDAYFGSGVAHSIAAGRLSYLLGLHGPSIAVDTACSSSLVAIHLAVQSLRSGECELALAGGVSLVLAPDGAITTSRGRMLAADGRCKTFDAAADGYVRGEGCGIVVLKGLSAALSDGDPILAVIRGSALNQDGRSNGLTAPNGRAQEAVIRAALADAGVSAADLDYVEAHGTGTSLGDPIELRALGAALGAGRPAGRPLLVGSVKTNIGHLEAAAGVAGLIKLVLALGHGSIPPHLHFHRPNPFVPWDTLPVAVPTSLTPWPAGEGRRLAGLSSFGFSGTNAHLIVAEPPTPPPPGAGDRSQHLLALSARDEAALAELAGRYRAYLAANPQVDLASLCATAAAGRAHFAHRLAVVAADARQLAERLAAPEGAGVRRGHVLRKEAPSVAFLFTGQGAQYAGMARALYAGQPTFRRALDRCAQLLDGRLDRPLLEVIFADEPATAALLDQTAYTQPALFAVEYALAELWRSWGVTPGAVLGHSVGEYVAAVVAGVLGLEDALGLVAARGRLMQALPAGGAMAAVFAPVEQVQAAVAPFAATLAVAAVNGPAHTVISGAAADLERALEPFVAAGVRVQRLAVSHAFHSPLMEPMLDAFAAEVARVRLGPPRLPLISNVSGRVAGAEVQHPAYWRDHVRAPVQFAAGMAALAAEGAEIFLELGPHPVLLGMGQTCLAADGPAWLPSLRRGRDDWQQIQECLAELYVRGAALDWAGVAGDAVRRRIALPTYPFQRRRYWLAMQPPAAGRTPRRPGEHPLLGQQVRSPALRQTLFEARLGAADPPFLGDHSLNGVAVFPAAAYAELALAAAAALARPAARVDLALHELLELPAEGTRTVQLVLSPESAERATFEVLSGAPDEPADGWEAAPEAGRPHAKGALVVGPDPAAPPAPVDLAAIRARCAGQVDVADFYARLADAGMAYGPAFQGLAELHRGEAEALGYARLPEQIAAESARYRLHPALLDACFQAIGAALPDPAQGVQAPLYVPVALEGVRLFQPGARAAWCHVTLDGAPGGDVVAAVVRLVDDAGRAVAEVERLQLRRIKDAAGARIARLFYDVAWRHQALAAPAPAALGSWLVYCDATGVGADLADELAAAGAAVVTAVAGPVTARLGSRSWQIDAADPGAPARLLREDLAGEPLAGVAYLWGLDQQPDTPAGRRAALEHAAAGALHLAQALVAYAGPAPRLWLVTRGAQAVGAAPADPPAAALWGFARVVASEQPALRCSCLDLDPSARAGHAAALAAELLADGPETQVALRGAERLVARLAPLPAPVLPAGRPVRLTLPARGALDALAFAPLARRAPGPGEVEIAVRASGLNFRDVLNVLGMYPGDPGPPGLECAGFVAAVGEGVAGLKVGDPVLAVAGRAFDSYVLARAELTAPVPPGLSFAEAVTLPSAYLTAAYGLRRLAKLQPGERVLVHAAAGGVGLAAVQLALAVGAEVFATAGSAEKHAFLRAMGVRHIFSSRSLDFAEQIRAATGGAGVDVVLNSLADAFVERSVATLAQGGRFLEIGKRGIWSAERFAAARPDAAYFPYDLAAVLDDEPEAIPVLLREVCAAAAEGEIRPLPLRAFPAAAIAEAFRHMAQARHIGKVVISHHPDAEAGPVRPDACYLITGGLGGLGLAVARWLASRGARHLALVGRRAPTPAAEAALAALRAAGAAVQVVAADISRADEVARVLAVVAAGPAPLRGVFHAAGVLDDGVLEQQRWERFEGVLAPKAGGAWHLHDQTRGLHLDHFVLFSSAAALLGAPGQGNYAAANALLDALAHQRRAAGLPALSVNWGAWAEVGMAAALGAREQRRAAARGVGSLTPAEGVAALEALLARGSTQVAVLPIDWRALREQFPAGQLPPLFAELAVGAPAPAAADDERAFRRRLADAPADVRLPLLVERLTLHAARVLGLDESAIAPGCSLSDLGIDSLMAMELKHRIDGDLGGGVPVAALLAGPSVAALAAELAATWSDAAGQAVPQAPPGLDRVATPDQLLAGLDQLSDDDVDAMLDAMLNDQGGAS